MLPLFLTILCRYTVDCFYDDLCCDDCCVDDSPRSNLNYILWVNFIPLGISISTLFLGGIPTWLLYIIPSFGVQLMIYWYRNYLCKLKKHEGFQSRPIQFSGGRNVNFEFPIATSHNVPSAPAMEVLREVLGVNIDTTRAGGAEYVVPMSQSERVEFELFKKSRAQDSNSTNSI